MRDTEPPFNHQRVKRIVKFCELLTVPDGADAGKRIRLRPWQKEIIASVYGPSTDEGLLLTREALLTIGRKNSKTALCAMLCLVHLCGPESVRNGELYSVAFDRDQAAQVFKYASGMVYADEALSARLNVVDSRKTIIDPVSGSKYQALSSESRSKHGRSSSFIIFDELAQFGRNRQLYDVMMTSRGAHREPLVWVISTQADSDTALMSELVDHGKKINSGEIVDPTFKAFIYEVPKEADAWDEANWHLANPALGDFLNLELMRTEAHKAKTMPGAEGPFRNLHLNQRVSADAAFIPPDIWQANADPCLEDVFFGDAPVYAGIDLSSKNDLTALVLVALDEEKRWHVKPYFWTPGDNLKERAQRDRVPYDLWAREGYLTATPGKIIDYEYVARAIADIRADCNLAALRFDRWGLERLAQELARIGLPVWIDGKDEPNASGLRLIPHGQGFKDFSPAVERVEDLLLAGRIRHGNHPVLTMCAANTRVIKDPAGNRKFDKIRSTGRIDGLVAMAMALNWTAEVEDDGQGSLDDLYASKPIVINW